MILSSFTVAINMDIISQSDAKIDIKLNKVNGNCVAQMKMCYIIRRGFSLSSR